MTAATGIRACRGVARTVGCILLASALCAPALQAVAESETVRIPAGSWEPLFSDSDADIAARGKSVSAIEVPAFEIDRHLVTNLDFHRFTQAHPEWKPSQAVKLLADDNYLSHWYGDDLSKDSPAYSPVVNISWFSAKSYCGSRGMALPTVAQWEYVAAASADETDASDDPAFLKQLTEWYLQTAKAKPSPIQEGRANAFGVVGMHEEIWEWTLDFNVDLVTGDARGDTGIDRQLFCAGASVGAADFYNYPAFLRYAMRSNLDGRYTTGSLGFRCVKNPEGDPL